jgi:SAM-dependent methyltransferase
MIRKSLKAIDRDFIYEMMSGYRASCVLGAGAELDVFTQLSMKPQSSRDLARKLACDQRSTAVLLDALGALGLLAKREDRYSVPPSVRVLLSGKDSGNILPAVWHAMTCLRAWAQLGKAVKSGKPARREASVRGFQADRAAFIGAMHAGSGPIASSVVKSLGKLKFSHLLDVGGASGTWTLAFMKAFQGTRATLFDLPDAVVQARVRIRQSPYADRVNLVAGDFYLDKLPKGADLAWVSAIIHQHSRSANRRLFAKIFSALPPGGQIAIRDIVMEDQRIFPVAGALFAVNMLVNTESGGTFTFREIAADLKAVGFVRPKLLVRSNDMNSVVTARKT